MAVLSMPQVFLKEVRCTFCKRKGGSGCEVGNKRWER